MHEHTKLSNSEHSHVEHKRDWPRLVTEIVSRPGARRDLRHLALIVAISAVLIVALMATVLIVHPEIVTMFARTM
jgi:hypothetical protein